MNVIRYQSSGWWSPRRRAARTSCSSAGCRRHPACWGGGEVVSSLQCTCMGGHTQGWAVQRSWWALLSAGIPWEQRVAEGTQVGCACPVCSSSNSRERGNGRRSVVLGGGRVVVLHLEVIAGVDVKSKCWKGWGGLGLRAERGALLGLSPKSCCSQLGVKGECG